MTSDDMARDYLRRAAARRKALDVLLSAAAYPDVVRESQDITELALKGALRFVGVEPPKRHDVHRVLSRFAERFPEGWMAAAQELEAALDQLAEERSPAFYGDDLRGVPASDLFDEADARRAMAVADRLLDLYRRLLGDAGGTAG